MTKEEALKELDNIWENVGVLKENRLDLKSLLDIQSLNKDVQDLLLKMTTNEIEINKKLLILREKLSNQ